jgi:hypothetical protein
MTPETFAALLDDATRDAPPPGPGTPLAAGRRRLRRVRLTVGAAAVAVLAIGGTALATGGEPTPAPMAVDPTPSADQALLEECRAGERMANDAYADVFDGGDPRVVTVAGTGPDRLAVLEARDGDQWAVCTVAASTRVVSFDPGTFPIGSVPRFQVGRGCGEARLDPADPCATWQLLVTSRLPAEVAAVRLSAGPDTWDTTTVDGYLLVDRVAPVPGGRTYAQWVVHPGMLPRVSMTYLDASGTPIAAGAGVELSDPVGDLPPLSTYPTLGGPQHVF